MPLVREGIDHLDLALLHINEAIHRLPRPGKKCSGGVSDDLSLLTQRPNVRFGQGNPLHLA